MSALRALVAEHAGRLPLPRVRVPALAVPRPRTLAIVAAAIVLLAGGWLWLRDSSLAAVRDVTVTGLSNTSEAPRIRAALDNAAQDMTTLHVQVDDLRSATAAYPVVKDLRVSAHFPHRLDITVVEQAPVAAVAFESEHVAVAADGSVLKGVPVDSGLPVVAVKAPPGGGRLTDPRALQAIAVLAAAPPALRGRVQRVVRTRHGITLALRSGPDLYFGDPDRLAAKWLAAARVLADPAAQGALYIDLRIPERPAAGGLEDPNAQTDAGPGGTGGQPAPGTAPGAATPPATTGPAPATTPPATTTAPAPSTAAPAQSPASPPTVGNTQP